MDNRLTVIDRATEHHFIARTGDRIRLGWGAARVDIHPDDLPALAGVAEAGALDLRPIRTRDGRFRVAWDVPGFLVHWIVDAGLRLRPEDLEVVAGFVRAAERAAAATPAEADGAELPRRRLHFADPAPDAKIALN